MYNEIGDKMRKKIIIILIVVLLSFSIYKIYSYIRIKTAKIEIVLVDDLKLEFNEKKKVSDFIKSINGKITDDYIIDSSKLGKKDVKFEFINNDNIKLQYTFQIEVVDTVSPLIWLGNNYNVKVGSDIDLTKKILCGDNYDSKPKCYIEGVYDLNKEGSYDLVFKAEDNSGNIEEKAFTLNVYEPVQNDNKIEPVYTNFNEVKENYKNDKTVVGLDISSHQGEIDFKKLKEQGVEFVMIRVGYGYNSKYTLDKNFKKNIEEANKNNIKVGIYFYSYAKTNKEAINDAKWVLKQIKKYKVDLPIAFDWEEWANFNEYNLSFFGLTNMADVFIKEIEKNGYDGMLYSSKTYLDNIWLENDYDIWLAQYNNKITYTGDVKMWQICDNGKIDGIDKTVDIDIMYK